MIRHHIDRLAKDRDRRSLAGSEGLAEAAANDPRLFGELINSILSSDEIVRMRSADIIEKASRLDPDKLTPYKDFILSHLKDFNQQEVRWHVAQVVSRLRWNEPDAQRIFNQLKHWIQDDESRIVQADALEAIVRITRPHPRLAQKARLLVNRQCQSTHPSMRARCRKLIRENVI